MDPDVTLKMLREAIAGLANAVSDDDERECAVLVAGLAGALDEWLSSGGFLPDAWQCRAADHKRERQCDEEE